MGGVQGFLSGIVLFVVIFGHFFVLAVVAVTAATAGYKPRCHPGRRRASRGEPPAAAARPGPDAESPRVPLACTVRVRLRVRSESESAGKYLPSRRLPKSRDVAVDNFYSLVVELEMFATVHWTEHGNRYCSTKYFRPP